MITNKQSLNGKISQKKQSITGKLNYVEKERSDFRTQEKEVTPRREIQEVTADEGYDGLSKVTVDATPVQEKQVTPRLTTQVVEPDVNYTLSKVTVNPIAVQEKQVTPSLTTEIVEPDTNYTLSRVIINPIPTQEKTAKATTSQQEIVPDSNYVLSKVTIDPIVNQSKSVTPTKQSQTITADQNYDGISQVNVEPIPNNYIDTTDANATAINIRNSKTAYVNGTKITGTLPVLTYPVNPSSPSDYSYQFIAATTASKVVRDGTTYVMGSYQVATEQQPDSWMFEGNRKMKLGIPQNKVATAINLQPSQIKSGQTVLGIAGATQGGLSVTENGQYNVVNYDSVNVNVESGGNLVVPNGMKFQYSSLTDFPNWDFSEITSANSMFKNCIVTNIENLDMPNCTDISYMFNGSKVKKVSFKNIGNANNMSNMFNSCVNLEEVSFPNNFAPQYLVSAFYGCLKLETFPLDNIKPYNMSGMCMNCVALKNVPLLDTSDVRDMTSCFSSCGSLTIESLNNILAMCISATKISSSSDKTLKKVGLSQSQETTCETLSNWDAFIAAGWTSGY